MKKGIFRKGLVVSVIVLFIGVGIQPVFAGESITSTLDTDEDCIECQELDGISLLRAKILMFKVKVVTNVILSSKLGDIPAEIKEDCQEILDIIDLNSPLYNPIICLPLLLIILQIAIIVEIIYELADKYPILIDGLTLIMGLIDIVGTSIYLLGYDLGCW